jgi:hypothetical protein
MIDIAMIQLHWNRFYSVRRLVLNEQVIGTAMLGNHPILDNSTPKIVQEGD